MMYVVEFYENQNGESEVWEFLEKLREQSKDNKDARIEYKQKKANSCYCIIIEKRLRKPQKEKL